MASIGYARTSTADQNADLQRDALQAAGCERIFEDQASGTLTTRPQLDATLDHLREGDVLVVWRLDRLGRSMKHLVEVIGNLEDRGVGFRSLTEGVDSTTPTGRLVFHVFAALAEFERDLIVERTKAGLAAARSRGRAGGRRPSLSPRKVQLARQMYDEHNSTVSEIAEVLGVSRATVYRTLQRQEKDAASDEAGSMATDEAKAG